MGDKFYSLSQVAIFTFMALYIVFKPQGVLKILKLDKSPSLSIVIRVIVVIVAIGNIILNLNNFLQ